MSVQVTLQGIKSLQNYVNAFPGVIDEAKSLAIAETGRFAYRESSKAISDQVQYLDRAYLGSESSGGNRLSIRRGTLGGDPFIRIAARDRPTSLARAVQGSPGKGDPVRVNVRGGRTKLLKTAFVVKLRRGKTLTEDGFNRGLAIRLPKGASLSARRRLGVDGLPQIFPNVFLLYGPSVAQVFNSVATDVRPLVERKLETEFVRQTRRLLGRAR